MQLKFAATIRLRYLKDGGTDRAGGAAADAPGRADERRVTRPWCGFVAGCDSAPAQGVATQMLYHG